MPKMSYEGLVGVLLALVVFIFDQAGVRNPWVLWIAFALALLICSDAIVRSGWGLTWKITVAGLALVGFVLFAAYLHHQTNKKERRNEGTVLTTKNAESARADRAETLPSSPAKAQGLTQPPPTIIKPIIEYPALDFDIDPDKILVINNRGQYGVDDIRMIPTEYRFDATAWQTRELKLEMVSKVGGYSLVIAHIAAGKRSKPHDISKIALLHFQSFAELLTKNREEMDAEQRRYYALRFTFIDAGSRRRYCFYKVISGIKEGPSLIDSPDKAALGGPADENWFMFHIKEKIMGHQRAMYGSDIEEYKP